MGLPSHPARVDEMPKTNQELQRPLGQAAAVVRRSDHVVALAGAGLSVESGIPPYRGPGGLWTKHGQPPLLSYQEFVQDPKAWWDNRLRSELEPGNVIYEMKMAVDRAVPNNGHRALAELERQGLLRCTMTQNVDNLHREAGSRELLEIHGNRLWMRCTGCGQRWPRNSHVMGALPPTCSHCGGIVKLDTVMFGEPVPPSVLQACREQAERCDCMLLVGTSGTVNPAARLPLVAKETGAVIIEINPEATALTPWCDLVLTGPSGEVLPLLLEALK